MFYVGSWGGFSHKRSILTPEASGGIVCMCCQEGRRAGIALWGARGSV